MFGGAIGWNAAGVACIVAGLLLLAGTLHVRKLPVFAIAVFIAALGAAITVYAAAVHAQFHFFALTLCLAAVMVAVCHRRAEREPAT